MASEKQIQANRRNGLLSKGPVTPEGKAVSSMNALKTGIDAESQIIRGEDPAALEELIRRYYDRFQPQGPEECDLLDSAISSAWLLRRLRKTEAQIWNGSIDWDHEHGKHSNLQARAYTDRDKTLDRCHSRMASVERSLRVALETLVRLRKNGVDLPACAEESPVVAPAVSAAGEPLLPEPASPPASPESGTNPTSPLTPSRTPVTPPLRAPNVQSPISSPQSLPADAPQGPVK